MYERFTDKARKVMQLANQEAARLGHEYIGTEHLLLGLVVEGTGVAACVLKELEVSLTELRNEVEKFASPQSPGRLRPKLPLTPRARKALEYAMEESRRLQHNYVGTEHLLLGLLRETEGVANQVLTNLALTVESVRLETLQFLGHELPTETGSKGSMLSAEFPRSASLWSIPELVELDSGRAIIRIPDEQNVPLTPRVRAIIDTPEFQRLSEISQLGMVAKVYPGARHTRFEHALGVYHNALLYLRQLREDERFAQLVDAKTAELLIVSSLLHDIGHWPYCHPIEDLGLDGLPPHEQFARSFLGDGTELGRVLQIQWSIAPDEVVEVLAGSIDSPRLRLLRSILSGPIDIDKLDYLERDSLHCGVPYGRHFDKQRLIQSLVLNEAGDGLAITSKGKTAAELMVHSRYVMFGEVYWHHAVRSATSLFARAFYELRDRVDLPTLFHETDAGMITKLRQVAEGHPAAECLEAVFGRRRRLYKRAAEFSHLSDPEVYQRLSQRPYRELVTCSNQLAGRLGQALQQAIQPMQVLVDGPPPHREVEFAVDVFFPKERKYRPLRSVSPMIDALARTSFDDYVKRVRVFVAPELMDSVRQANLAEDWWRTAILDAS
jgi:uncharacterized protein